MPNLLRATITTKATNAAWISDPTDPTTEGLNLRISNPRRTALEIVLAVQFPKIRIVIAKRILGPKAQPVPLMFARTLQT